MKIVSCKQTTAEWWAVRRGVPTASNFHRIISPKKWEYATGAQTYIDELIYETYDPMYGLAEQYVSRAMENGNELEPKSKLYYELTRNLEVREVGFVLTDDGRFGYSPDAFVDPDGLLESKSPAGHTQIKWLRAGGIPDEHLGQCYGGLFVTGREWIDFQSYVPELPRIIERLTRDDKLEKLAAALDRFWNEYQEAKEFVAAKFGPPPTVEYTAVGLGAETFTLDEIANPIPF